MAYLPDNRTARVPIKTRVPGPLSVAVAILALLRRTPTPPRKSADAHLAAQALREQARRAVDQLLF